MTEKGRYYLECMLTVEWLIMGYSHLTQLNKSSHNHSETLTISVVSLTFLVECVSFQS